MRLVEVTVVAAKFKSFQKTITIFIFLNQRQNLGIIIAIFVIISIIIIIIIILATMQLRPCEIETLLVSGCSLTLQAWQYPHTNSPDWSAYISLKNYLREFDKRSKHLGQPLYNSEWILLCVYFHLPSGISAHKCTQVKWDFKVWWLSAWLQSLFPIIFNNYDFIIIF